MPLATCPGHDSLRDFRLGKLPAEDARQIAEHLDTCPSCQANIETISDAADTLLHSLRQPPIDEFDAEPDLRNALAAVQALGTEVPAQTHSGEGRTQVEIEALGALRDYHLLEELGAGGMGTVYKARHQRLKRIVALKVLPTDRTRDKRAVARFEREMEAVGKLEHPNIVRALDAGEHEGTHYLVMEFVDGLDLSQVVKQLAGMRGQGLGGRGQGIGRREQGIDSVGNALRGVPPVPPLPLGEGRGEGARARRMNVADACELVRQAAAGLQCAHEHGLVHRDIKPSNLMLTAAGQVKVLDLGLALLLAEQPGGDELTGTSQMMGTADYCAPEQAGDSHTVDIRADIYSLGCTLYKLLTGHAPFSGDHYNTTMKKVIAHTTLPVPAIRGERPDISEGLAAVLDRMLAKEPAQRYPTPADVLTAIAPFADGADLKSLFADASQPIEITVAPSETAETTPHLSSAMTGTHPSAADLPLASVGNALRGVPGEGGLHRIAAPHSGDATTETYIGRRPPRRRSLLIAAAAAGLVLMAGIFIIVRNKQGEVISKTEVPDGATVDVEDARGNRLATTAALNPKSKIENPKSPADAPLVTAFDHLQRSDIDPYELSVAALADDRPAPEDLVAVFGDSRMKHWGVVTALAFTPDGKSVVSGSADFTVRLWDRMTWQQRRIWRLPERIWSLEVSPDGKWLAVGAETQQFVLFDMETGSQRAPFQGMQRGMILAWSPDGARLAVGAGDGTVDLWDPVGGKLIKQLGQHLSPFWSMTFDPTNELLASSRIDGTTTVWDLKAMAERVTIRTSEPVLRIAFTADGRLFTAPMARDTISCFDSSDGTLIQTFAGVANCGGLAVGPDDELIAVGETGIVTFGVKGGEARRRFSRAPCEYLSLAIDKQCQIVAAGANDGFVRTWNVRTAEDLFVPEGHKALLVGIAVSPDGDTIASACADGSVKLWSTASVSERQSLSTNEIWAGAVTFSPDGRTLATAHSNLIRLWDANTGEHQRDLETPGGPLPGPIFSQDGKSLISASNDGVVRLWDRATGRETRKFLGFNGPVRALASSADGQWIAGVMGTSIKIWDEKTSKEYRELGGHTSTITSLCFSPDCATLLSAAGEPDATVKLWDVATGEEVRTFKDNMRTALCAAFSPDGKTIASASGDGKVRLWDPDPPRGKSALKRTIEIGPPGGLVKQVHWTPDGRHLVTLNGNGTVYVLRLESAPAAALAASKRHSPTSQAKKSSSPPPPTASAGDVWPADAPPPAVAPFNAEQAKKHQQAWADYLKLPIEHTNSIGMKFVLIPPGEFMMGSRATEIEDALNAAGDDKYSQECIRSEGPQHKVVLTQPIYLGVHEVTQQEYQAVMGKNPSYFGKMGPDGQLVEKVAGLDTENHPVEGVAWNDAAEFCTKLCQQENLKPFYFRSGDTISPLKGSGYRLPTEAEWEFACRAGTTSRFWNGDSDQDLVRAGWFGPNSGGRTHEVEELLSNPFGLFDIHGNVSEWVQDAWDPRYYQQFAERRAVDPSYAFSAATERIVRGGYFDRTGLCRSSGRRFFRPSDRSTDIGFRVALMAAIPRGAPEPLEPNPSQNVFSSLRREDIPPYELSAAALADDKPAPKEIVAIIGDSRMKHWGAVTSLALTPDNKSIISGGPEGTIRVWDRASGQQSSAWFVARAGEPVGTALSPDGRTIAVGNEGVQFEFVDFSTRARRQPLEGPWGQVMAWGPDGKLIASGSAAGDGNVDLWDPLTGEHIRDLGKQGTRIVSLAFDGSGTRLVAAVNGGTIKVWDVQSGATPLVFKSALPGWSSAIFTPDGRLLVGGSHSGEVAVYDATTGDVLKTVNAGQAPHYQMIAGLPNGLCAVAGNTIDLFDLNAEGFRKSLGAGGSQYASLAASGGVLAGGCEDGFIHLWDLATEREVFASRGHQAAFDCVLTDGEIASASADGTVKFWDISTGKERLTFRAEQGPLHGIAYNAVEHLLATIGSFPHVVRLWDAVSGEARGELMHPPSLHAIAFSDDGKTLVSAGSSGTLKVWDVKTRSERAAAGGYDGGIHGVAISPDNRWFAAGGDGAMIKVWDAQSGKEYRTLLGHTSRVASLSFSPDSTTLVSAAFRDDPVIKVWDIATGEEVRTFKDDMRRVNYATFSPDGKTIASASGDGKVRLWDPDPPRGKSALRRTIEIGPPGGLVKQVHFTPDGRHLVTLNGNSTIYVLRLEE